jgi:hypothetical protein
MTTCVPSSYLKWTLILNSKPYHHSLVVTSPFHDGTLFYNRREIPGSRPLYKMATLHWKTNVLITLISCLSTTDGANILGIFPMPIKSHMTVHSALVKELARTGHQVTVFSPFPEKSPIQNFTDVEFKMSYHELRQSTGEHNIRLLGVFGTRYSQIVKQSYSWKL